MSGVYPEGKQHRSSQLLTKTCPFFSFITVRSF